MKTLVLMSLMIFSFSAAAQGYQSTLLSTDNPKLKCADGVGGYYVFYQLEKTEDRDSFIVLIPIEGVLGYEYVTVKKDFKNLPVLKFETYDPIDAIKTGKKSIFQMTLNLVQNKMTLFAKKSGKTYNLACTIPVLGVDYE